jgi:hypothetical protein
VAYLAHQECPVSGEAIFAAGGRVKLFEEVRGREGDLDGGLGSLMTGGYYNPELTIDDVAEHWAEIVGADFRPIVFPEEPPGGEHVPYRPS